MSIDFVIFTKPDLASVERGIVFLEYMFFSVLTFFPMIYMIHFSSVSYVGNVGHIERIDINQISVKGGKVQLKVCNKDFPHKDPIRFPLRNEVFGD